MKHNSGKRHWNWRGGKKINSQGYVLIYNPSHPFCDNQSYVREHRLVYEKSLGRFLKKDEVIHHLNKIKSDNRIENLQLLPKRQHDRVSRLEHKRKKKLNKVCLWCKTKFEVFPSLARLKFCSMSCSKKHQWEKGGSGSFGR